MVDVCTENGFAFAAGCLAPDGVVEDDDFVGCAGEFCEEELFDFRVVGFLYAFVAGKIGLAGLGFWCGENGEEGVCVYVEV